MQAAATAANNTFFQMSCADFASKYVGDSETLVRKLFQQAREKAPSLIFIDEVCRDITTALFPARCLQNQIVSLHSAILLAKHSHEPGR